jgi:hypothetical protein
MFLIVGRRQEPPSFDDEVIAATLGRLRLEPRWLDPAQLMPDSAAGSIGVILTDQLGPDSISMDRFVAFLGELDVPLLAIGGAASLLAQACEVRTEPRVRSPAVTRRIDVDNSCVLFDFLPNTIELEGWLGSSLGALSSHLSATAHDGDRRAVAFEHHERELFAVDFPIAVAGDAGLQVVDNFARYAGTASGEL